MPKSHTTPQLPFKFVGGFELSTKRIGLIMSVQGALQMVAQIFVFPYINRRFGSLWTFRMAICGYPILYFLVPYLSLVRESLRYPAIFVLLVWKVTAQALSYPSNNIMLVNQSPSKKVLGTLNGIAASAASLARTAGPTLAGAVQAAGLKLGYSGISWWSCAVVAIVGVGVGLVQQEKRAGESCLYGRLEEDVDEEQFFDESLLGRSSFEYEQSDDCETGSSMSSVLGQEEMLIADL
jgi:hypothetical protein